MVAAVGGDAGVVAELLAKGRQTARIANSSPLTREWERVRGLLLMHHFHSSALQSGEALATFRLLARQCATLQVLLMRLCKIH